MQCRLCCVHSRSVSRLLANTRKLHTTIRVKPYLLKSNEIFKEFYESGIRTDEQLRNDKTILENVNK